VKDARWTDEVVVVERDARWIDEVVVAHMLYQRLCTSAKRGSQLIKNRFV